MADTLAPDPVRHGPRFWSRRRLGRLLAAVELGVVVAALTYGGLGARRAVEGGDILPAGAEAALLGAAFTLAALPVGWSGIARIFVPVPTFFVYLSILSARDPPLPFFPAFLIAAAVAAVLTALSAVLAERPQRSTPGLRRRRPGRKAGPSPDEPR